MKNVTTYSTGSDRDLIKTWLFGVACGAVLTISVALGTGHLEIHRSSTWAPVPAVQQSAPAIKQQLVPPPIDEYVHYQRLQAATNVVTDASDGLVPPPLNEIRMYQQSPATFGSGTALPTPPLFGLTPY